MLECITLSDCGVLQYRACVIDVLGLGIHISGCITLLCVQPILILSTFFLCHPYIPFSNLRNFSFTYALSFYAQ